MHNLLMPSVILCGLLATANAPAQTAQEIHRQAIVIDSHSDFLDRSAIDGSRLNADPPGSQTTLKKLQAGQVDAQWFSVFAPPAYRDYGFAARTLELIDRLHQEIEANAPHIALATTSAQVHQLVVQGKIAALIGIEGGHSIENRLSNLRNYYRLGVRYMTLTWNNSNDWADASNDSARWSGLNNFGLEVIAEMNRLGMLIDISHVSDDTFWDVLKHTRSPIIASHSSARALRDAKRNMSDDMIKAMANNGGVIQVSFYSRHLTQEFADQFEKAIGALDDQVSALGAQHLHDPIQLDIARWSLELELERTLQAPPLAVVADHIDHMVKLAGINHVGLGSDYDGMGAAPVGLEHVGKLPALTVELLNRGYSEADLGKILGGNLLRVMEANERIAAQLASEAKE